MGKEELTFRTAGMKLTYVPEGDELEPIMDSLQMITNFREVGIKDVVTATYLGGLSEKVSESFHKQISQVKKKSEVVGAGSIGAAVLAYFIEPGLAQDILAAVSVAGTVNSVIDCARAEYASSLVSRLFGDTRGCGY